MARSSIFRFRHNDIIGQPSAESDGAFLNTCFVDTGAIRILQDVTDARCIAYGRTGSGKTALLRQFTSSTERCTPLDPHDISIRYIANSTVLSFFESLGVVLDPFYRFLWRHVLVVELLKQRFSADAASSSARWRERIFHILRTPQHREAIEYLEKWGGDFVSSTKRQVEEVISNVEQTLNAEAGVAISELAKLGASGTETLSSSQREIVKTRGEEVLNRIQIEKLSALYDALDEDIFDDHKKHYYISMDGLDENWIEDKRRIKVLRALIEVARDLNSKVRFVKILLAARTDLFERMITETTDVGFQSEKFRGLCLPFQWTPDLLKEVVDRRLDDLVRRQWTSEPATHHELIQGTIGKKQKIKALDYMIDRTMLRPRDIISFVNICMSNADGVPYISPQIIVSSESEYSRQRMQSLTEEWSGQHPLLREMLGLLKKRPQSFHLGEITQDDLLDFCAAAERRTPDLDPLFLSKIGQFLNLKIDELTFRNDLILALYEVGALGLKPESYTQIHWSYTNSSAVSDADLNDDCHVYPHKMLWRTLGVAAA